MTASTWRKSSYSADEGGCVEVAQPWRKSTYSGEEGGCVEVSPVPADIRVRDTKDRTSGSLTFATLPWRTFLTHVTRSA